MSRSLIFLIQETFDILDTGNIDIFDTGNIDIFDTGNTCAFYYFYYYLHAIIAQVFITEWYGCVVFVNSVYKVILTFAKEIRIFAIRSPQTVLKHNP